MRSFPTRFRSLAALVPVAAAFATAGAVPSAAQGPARWTVEAPTGPTRDLAFDATEGTWMSLSISPDGRSIAFDLLGHIYEMPIEGGTARRLTEGRSWNLFPRYSPDGRWIAFTSDRSGTHNLWIMDRQGGNLRAVSPTHESVYKAVWSADGRRIFGGTTADGAPSRLVAFELAGGRQALVTGGGALNAATAEPGGGGVLFERSARAPYPFEFNPYVIPAGGTSIERFDLATGETSVVVRRIGGVFSPALSADGGRLAYVNRHLEDTRLIVRDLATREERVLLSGLDRDRQTAGSDYGPYPTIAWHPDGRRIFVNKGGQLLSVDATSGAATAVAFRAPVQRSMSETIRFATREPDDRARTRTHRWGTRIPQGILFEAMGDLWLQDPAGSRRNLTSSDAHETSPVFDPATGALYYATWSDDSLGAIHRRGSLGGPAERLTRVAAQYGSLAVGPGGRLAYVRGAGGLERGAWLSNEAEFDLIVREPSGAERRITGLAGQPLVYADIAGKIPPTVSFGPDGSTLYFTEFERDTLTLKRIGVDGSGEAALVKFPNAIAAVPSPDLRWIAVREYQRSFLVPLAYAGQPVVSSPWEGVGHSIRVDAEDGGYLTWSADGRTLAWTRATGFYEKDLDQILATAPAPVVGAGAPAWNGPRVPGSTARRTETAIEFALDTPTGTVALTGARVITMNARREVLDGATVVIRGNRIVAVGRNVTVPAGAKVYDLAGATIIPGLIDAHAHPHIEQSALHVIEQRPTYLSGPLAYGVTTVVEVYGNEYRDGWLSDMLRAGKITGPRFFTTGSVIFGQRRAFRARMYRPIETLDDALEQLRWNRDHGAIAVKDYAQDTRKRRHLTATAARILGLNVVSESNADPQMNLTQLMDGVTGIEHSMGLAPFFDDVVRYWGGTAAGNTPTLLVVYNGAMGEGWYHQTSKLWEDPKLTRFIAPEQLMRVRNPTHLWPEDMFAWTMAKEVRKLFKNGNSVQLGAHGQMFGLDAHWELDLLTRGGFTPAEALEVATIRGASYHGLDADLGSLETGKLADLVVLDANPLDQIANAQKIRYVMKNGVLHAGADAARVWPDPRPAGKPYFFDRQ